MATAVVGALPASVDLALYAGDDFLMTVAVQTSDGTPVDLTGYTPQAQIRANERSGVLANFSIQSIDTSTLRLGLTSADTAFLPELSVWDLQMVDAGGVVMTLVRGDVRTKPEVTR